VVADAESWLHTILDDLVFYTKSRCLHVSYYLRKC